MTTLLISKEGKYRAIVREVPNGINDGFHFKVDVTGKVISSQKKAIKNARAWLKKKRQKYYEKHPEKRVRIKARRLVPKEQSVKRKATIKINKLYTMKESVAKILVRMSDKKLKIHLDYSRKKFDSKTTTAVSGETTDFNTAIYTVMEDGTKKERKKVAKMLRKFTHEPFRNTNMFY